MTDPQAGKQPSSGTNRPRHSSYRGLPGHRAFRRLPHGMPCILLLFTRILRTIGRIWEQEVPGVFEAGAGFDSRTVWARSPAIVPRHICPEFCPN